MLVDIDKIWVFIHLDCRECGHVKPNGRVLANDRPSKRYSMDQLIYEGFPKCEKCGAGMDYHKIGEVEVEVLYSTG